MRKDEWLMVLKCALIGVQAILEFLLGYVIFDFNILPVKYFILVILLLVALLVIPILLMFLKRKKKKTDDLAKRAKSKKLNKTRQIIGAVLSVVLSVCMVIGVTFVSDAQRMVNTVTNKEETKTVKAIESVYILASDDNAKAIEDNSKSSKKNGKEDTEDTNTNTEAPETGGKKKNSSKKDKQMKFPDGIKNYQFGTLLIDKSNTETAVSAINDETGSKLVTHEFNSAPEEVQALYDGTVNAIILSDSFVSLVTEQDQYKDFDQKVKKVYEYVIYDNTPAKKVDNKVSITEKPFIMYISGSDTRSKILDVSRSDVNILMVVNPRTKQIFLLNTPRDYFVPNPAGNNANDKLTHLGIYGVDNSIKGLNQLYNTNIDYYMQINFTGFETLIDAIGGIDVNSDAAFTVEWDWGGYSYTQGMNHLNGAQALAFARDRYHQADGDNARGRHQMMVIQAVIDKMTSTSTLLTNYSSIMNSLSGMFVTDMSSDDISALVKMQINDMAKWNIKNFAVVGTGGDDYTYSMPSTTAYVMYPDQNSVDKASSLIKKIDNGGEITDADVSTEDTSEDAAS